MTNEELAATYVQLLIIQYSDPNNQPNAIATINLLATEAIANQIVLQVLSGFSINDAYGQTPAVGVQLDILGQFVGAERFLDGYSPPINYFSYGDTVGPDNNAYGFGDIYNNIIPLDYWESTVNTAGTYTLSDGQMSQLIQYLATKNNMYMSLENIDNLLFSLFGTEVTVEETNMELQYSDAGGNGSVMYGVINYLNAFPHPAGVNILT